MRQQTIATSLMGRRSSFKPFSVWAIAGLMLFSAVFGAFPAQARTAPISFADLAEKLLPAVVNISTTQKVEGRGGVEIPQLPPGSPFEDFFKVGGMFL